jgi:hypothetical protein
MKFYRVDLYTDEEGSEGYAWFTSKREATAKKAEYSRDARQQERNPSKTTIEEINVTPTRTGILEILNSYASHPDNG